MTNKILVGVYGSLKTGESNNGLLIGSELVGTGTTVNSSYDLLDFGGYPGAIPGSNKLRVEVWSIDDKTLTRLDRLESHPHFYKREEIPIEMDTNKILLASVYLLTKPDSPSYSSLNKVEAIDSVVTWRKYA